MIKVALMILAGLSYLFNSWFSLACITSFPFIALFSYWYAFVQIAKCKLQNVFVKIALFPPSKNFLI